MSTAIKYFDGAVNRFESAQRYVGDALAANFGKATARDITHPKADMGSELSKIWVDMRKDTTQKLVLLRGASARHAKLGPNQAVDDGYLRALIKETQELLVANANALEPCTRPRRFYGCNTMVYKLAREAIFRLEAAKALLDEMLEHL